MKSLSLKKFGPVLTGRPFGAQAYREISQELESDLVELDLSGVLSLGSSFGEEVVVPLAKRQNNSIRVRSANAPVRDCIELIASDFKLNVEFL